jgi:hypothetical protein
LSWPAFSEFVPAAPIGSTATSGCLAPRHDVQVLGIDNRPVHVGHLVVVGPQSHQCVAKGRLIAGRQRGKRTIGGAVVLAEELDDTGRRERVVEPVHHYRGRATTTNGQGRYVIDALGAGRFTTRAAIAGYAAKSLTVSLEADAVQPAISTWGYGRWAWNVVGEVQMGAMMLDNGFEQSDSPYRRSLRAHELGHTLGYDHVASDHSVMNLSGRIEPTTFAVDATTIAFRRMPLNRSPDIDPDPVTVNHRTSMRSTVQWEGAK